MKYYKSNNEVFAYEEDGSQDDLIGDKVLMTAEEVELHIKPPKTEEQIIAEKVIEYKAYLASTDWYYARKAETSEDVPTDVVAKRIEYRTYIQEHEL